MFMSDKNISLPDWLGSGEDLFATIQIIQSKNINIGFLEIDYNFKFSNEFNYPVIFTLKTIGVDIVADCIAFRIDEKDPNKRMIEENFVAPSVSRILTHHDFIKFFADVVRDDITFALYIDNRPRKFRDLRFCPLTEKQKITLNERLSFEIMECLDRQRAVQSLLLDADESQIF
jgi:hypothetical protein